MSAEYRLDALSGPVNRGQDIAAASSLTTTSRLVTLPEELLSNIAVKLGSDDIFALRLTCRDIYAKVRAVSTL